LKPGELCAHGSANSTEELYQIRGYHGDTTPEQRTPTPKMLLGTDGKLQWPVFQFGGSPGTGMLISTTQNRFAPAPKADPTLFLKQPGRENFLLNGNLDLPLALTAENGKIMEANPDLFKHSKSFLLSEDDRKLLGWLQIRDPNNRKQRQYVPVVNPAPEGPFRKAPWHGNIHVLKF
jgi:hypothetical protein